MLNLDISKDKTAGLTNASFQYVIREYYIIIWAFLLKHDYAFKVFSKNISLKISFCFFIFRLKQKARNPRILSMISMVSISKDF
jgi:hypothetical protein